MICDDIPLKKRDFHLTDLSKSPEIHRMVVNKGCHLMINLGQLEPTPQAKSALISTQPSMLHMKLRNACLNHDSLQKKG